jgi:hypothetical protein
MSPLQHLPITNYVHVVIYFLRSGGQVNTNVSVSTRLDGRRRRYSVSSTSLIVGSDTEINKVLLWHGASRESMGYQPSCIRRSG